MKDDRDDNAFIATVVVAFALHFFVSHLYPSLTWIDEVFQTLEQGHRLAFGYGVVPWEFRDGVRSWVLPGLLGLVMRGTAFLGPGSSGYLLGVRLFLSLCSLVPVVVAMQWAKRAKLQYPWIAGLATAVWFELVFFAPKALTEVFAAYAIAVALYFCVATAEDPAPSRAALWAGLAWGFAVGFRVHLAPAALVAFIWTCEKDARRWKLMLAGGAAVIFGFGLLDAITWQFPFQSFFMNYWVNVVRHKADYFGTSPPWEYLRAFAFVWNWGALPLLALAALSFRRWPVLAAVAFIVFASHSVIAHKEYRFLVPFIVIVVMAAALELARLVEQKRAIGLAACAVFVLASLDGARRFDFAELPHRVGGTQAHKYPPWTLRSGELKSFAALSTNPQVCGVGVTGWGSTGGYTYLHKDIPIYDVTTKEAVDEKSPHFNYLVSLGENGDQIGAFEKGSCLDGVCLYTREGTCTPEPGYSLNGWLADGGM